MNISPVHVESSGILWQVSTFVSLSSQDGQRLQLQSLVGQLHCRQGCSHIQHLRYVGLTVTPVNCGEDSKAGTMGLRGDGAAGVCVPTLMPALLILDSAGEMSGYRSPRPHA